MIQIKTRKNPKEAVRVVYSRSLRLLHNIPHSNKTKEEVLCQDLKLLKQNQKFYEEEIARLLMQSQKNKNNPEVKFLKGVYVNSHIDLHKKKIKKISQNNKLKLQPLMSDEKQYYFNEDKNSKKKIKKRAKTQRKQILNKITQDFFQNQNLDLKLEQMKKKYLDSQIKKQKVTLKNKKVQTSKLIKKQFDKQRQILNQQKTQKQDIYDFVKHYRADTLKALDIHQDLNKLKIKKQKRLNSIVRKQNNLME